VNDKIDFMPTKDFKMEEKNTNTSERPLERLVMLPCKKRTYKTKRGAKWFGRIFVQYYYRCPNCGYFHLTKKKQPRQTFLIEKAT
jgi:DNA-directed RNA polymerase subunit RPC12/RpoP